MESNPGEGGWPTIRYFSKATGYEGASYIMKTQGAVCDELGKESYMESYVLEAGKTFLCLIDTKKGCGDRELEFLESYASNSIDEVTSQLTRLEKMSEKDSSMKPDFKNWMRQTSEY